jgi:hypothetical membrane protein
MTHPTKGLALNDANKAGVALFLGVVQFGLFEMIAEFVYPGYSVSFNYISDLGPPCTSGNTCPSATSWWIFDTSIIVLGLCVLISGYFIQRHYHWKPASSLIAVAGIGAVGVGIFNETAPFDLHGLFSLITFLGIGLAATVSFWLQKRPLSYFSLILGLVTLISLVLYVPDGGSFGVTLGIGKGGLERMIVYPVLFWSLAFSGHMMAIE